MEYTFFFNIKNGFLNKLLALGRFKRLLGFMLFCSSLNASAADVFDPISSVLTIANVAVGDVLHSNVKVKLGVVISIGTQSVDDSYDTYNPLNNQLTIPVVSVGTTKYYNVVVTVGDILSVGSSCVGVTNCFAARNMSQYWAGEETGLSIPRDSLSTNRWFDYFESTDINNDGTPDILLTETTISTAYGVVSTNSNFLYNKPTIILGGEEIKFGDSVFQTAIPEGQGFTRIVTYDINGDGRDDILFQDSGPDGAASPGGQSRFALSSNKGYQFINLPEALAFTHSSAAGEIAGNKVLFFNSLSGEVSIPFLLIYKNGSFVMDRGMLPSFITDSTTDPWAPTIQRPVRSFTGSAIGDVDGDGIDDLILGQWGPYGSNLLPSGLLDPLSASNIIFGTSSGWSSGRKFKLPNPTSLPPEKVTVLDIKLADLFGSGKKDIIIVYTDNYKSRGLQILKNNGGGNFTDVSEEVLGAGTYYVGGNEAQSIVIDVNGDDCLDIVLPYYKHQRGDGRSYGEVFLSDCKGRFVDATQAFNALFLDLMRGLECCSNGNGLNVDGGIFLMPLKDYTGRTSFYILIADPFDKVGKKYTHIFKLKNIRNMPTPVNGKLLF